jgi:hypothetical protein
MDRARVPEQLGHPAKRGLAGDPRLVPQPDQRQTTNIDVGMVRVDRPVRAPGVQLRHLEVCLGKSLLEPRPWP